MGAAAQTLDEEAISRDDELIDSCLRVLSVAGGPEVERKVAALSESLARFDEGNYWVGKLREEAWFAAARLRVRHRWNREEVARMLRAAPDGTWAREDHAKWLRGVFREKDPEGWTAFLVEEADREGARPADVVAVAADLKDLPADLAGPVLRRLLRRSDPYVRLEAALAVHSFDPEDAAAKAVVVGIALDRSIPFDRRPDLGNHWSRIRALHAAFEWGGLAAEDLQAHLAAPEAEHPLFRSAAAALLAKAAADRADDE